VNPRRITRNRNEFRTIQALTTVCREYTLDNGFSGVEVAPQRAWNAFADHPFVKLFEHEPGRRWRIEVHHNRYYELTVPEPELVALADRGYNITGWKRWQQGGCHAYALGLIEIRSALRFGTIVQREQTGEDTFDHETHHFAHDDTYAYDSAGRHPLPYLGIDPPPNYHAVLDDDPAYYDSDIDPDEIAAAVAHADEHRILAGRYGPADARATADSTADSTAAGC
jgi:hypothetical protein